MINENELNISSMSYINKDFQAIYPELLDLVKTLTNRWDPASSNESDPGVVLLKVGALLADHLNYNIDKNILEAFLPSATQEESVRYIAEFGGYTPRYYRSAVGDVSVIYNPDDFTGSFKIPAFSLVISNNDGSITYTQIEDIDILNKNIAATGKFIEGTVQKLSVDSDVITLKNLDNNNRLYFPTQYVAENGVYIWNVNAGQASSDLWVKTNYLYTRPQGTRCYKIDFDSKKGLPYIEFPSDIANLIGNGLMINYIYTAGSYGNISAGELNTIVSVNSNAIGFNIDADKITVSNSSAINSGAEPETIEEIYRNYKKTVGTFDTLVSLQDYTNAINLATDSYGQKLISNGVVTDRRTDYNNAINITTDTTFGTITVNEPINSFGKFIFKGYSATAPADPKPGWIYSDNTDTYLCTSLTSEGAGVWEKITDLDFESINEYLEGMSPYDLIIYALKKYSELDYNSIYYWNALNNSYKQIPSISKDGNNIDNVENLLIADLEKYKCINHIFNDLKTGQVYCFKNYLPLNITIIPFNKVSNYERAEIINNIRKCISDNFNASKINFGEEINYDELKRAIENCDERINYVNIADFEYNTKVMLKSTDPDDPENEKSIFSSFDDVTFIADLAAKNILAGRLCLFDFDENFDYQYGQKDCAVYSNINAIATKLTINCLNSEGSAPYSYDYTLKDNEYFEIIYPKYYSDKTYGSYVLFHAKLNGTVPAGVEYTLANDEYIDLYYKDSNGNVFKPKISGGEIIYSSFDLKNFADDSSYTYEKSTGQYKQIASNESISTRVLMSTKFNSNKYVYWITNNPDNILFNDGVSEIVLEDNEFFMYTDNSKKYLTILGRGTKITRSDSTGDISLPATIDNKAIRQRISDEGLAADIPFILYEFTNDNNITLTQTNVTVLGSGNKVRFKCDDKFIDYNLRYANEISYSIDDEETSLPLQSDFYQIRSRLDIIMSSDSPQVLKENQLIAIRSGTNIYDITGNNLYLRSNVDLDLIGNVSDSSIDISLFADFGVSVNMIQYGLERTRIGRYVKTNTAVTLGFRGWAVTLDDKYRWFTGTETTLPIETYYTMNDQTRYDNDIPDVIDCSIPAVYYLPFSTVWYNYLSDSEAIINRQYISELHYSRPDNTPVEGKDGVRIQYVPNPFIPSGSGASPRWDPLYYGFINKPNQSSNACYLLDNQSTYVYPNITSEGDQNFYLRLDIAPSPNSYITVYPLKVSWNIKDYGTGGYGDAIVDRINSIIDKTGSNVQFHWTNIPSNEMALSNDNLVDPYSLFDKNNVANIITIPQIDLENSTIEVIKSMRK